MRIRIGRGFWTSRFGIGLLAGLLAILVAATSVLAYYYIQFGHLIEQRLTGQIFQNTSRVYSAPGHIYTGESLRSNDLATYLLRAGYQEGEVPGAPGQFRVAASAIEIRPSADSYFQGHNALRVDFSGSQISRISQMPDGTQVARPAGQAGVNVRDVPHAGYKVVGDKTLKLLTVHIVDKGKPMTVPAK